MRTARDDLGTEVRVPTRARRVVSLVPSLTEAVAATDRTILAGATRWCTHPADLDVARVGGTKNPDVAAIRALAPDLVLANAEENRRADLDALRSAGLAVWVTAPATVPEGLASLAAMLAACGLGAIEPAQPAQPGWLVRAREEWSSPYDGPRHRAVVPIWRRPWMALGANTFAGDLLSRLGVDNVLAGHAERYPRIDPADLPGHDLVVLPDEPYAFGPKDGPEAFPGVPFVFVSGRLLTWYGPSLVTAREALAARLAELPGPGSA